MQMKVAKSVAFWSGDSAKVLVICLIVAVTDFVMLSNNTVHVVVGILIEPLLLIVSQGVAALVGQRFLSHRIVCFALKCAC